MFAKELLVYRVAICRLTSTFRSIKEDVTVHRLLLFEKLSCRTAIHIQTCVHEVVSYRTTNFE